MFGEQLKLRLHPIGRLLSLGVYDEPCYPCKWCGSHKRVRLADDDTRCLPCAKEWQEIEASYCTDLPWEWWEDGDHPDYMAWDGVLRFKNKYGQRMYLFLWDVEVTGKGGRVFKAGERIHHGTFTCDIYEGAAWYAFMAEHREEPPPAHVLARWGFTIRQWFAMRRPNLRATGRAHITIEFEGLLHPSL